MMRWSDRSEKWIQETAAKATGVEGGKAELAQKVIAWKLRRMEAERHGEFFNEPPPTE